MQNKQPYKNPDSSNSIVNDKGNATDSKENQAFSSVLNWLEEYQEFMSRFQTKEDYQNSMKIKGNKYGVYTQEVIEKTYELRKRQ